MRGEVFPYLVHVMRAMGQLLKCPAEQLMPGPSVTLAMNAVLRSWQRSRKVDSQQRRWEGKDVLFIVV